MEKAFAIIRLGIKYLYRHRRRYYFLLAAIIFGFTIVTFITSTKDGMYNNVYYSAQSHYAGDIVALGHEYYRNDFIHILGSDEIPTILAAADQSGINIKHTVFRTFAITHSAPVIHFNGIAAQLRYIMGCDWENEYDLISKMDFEHPVEFSFGDDGIILSLPVAQQLGVKLGDSVILELDTRFLQKNTATFIVKGIVQDSSIFGYFKAYVSKLTLNRLILFEDEDCSTIGFFLNNPATAEQDRFLLQQYLSSQIQTGELVYDRESLDRERSKRWQGNMVFLYTLPVYLSEISALLDAMNLLTYFLYGMMLLTILASAGVTYRLILHERSREMGVMRSIGFYGKDLRLILLTEVIILGMISMVIGFFAANLLSWAFSFFSFSWLPGFEIFLKGGKLMALYIPATVAINISLLLLVLVLLTFFQSLRVTRKVLPELLSGDPL